MRDGIIRENANTKLGWPCVNLKAVLFHFALFQVKLSPSALIRLSHIHEKKDSPKFSPSCPCFNSCGKYCQPVALFSLIFFQFFFLPFFSLSREMQTRTGPKLEL